MKSKEISSEKPQEETVKPVEPAKDAGESSGAAPTKPAKKRKWGSALTGAAKKPAVSISSASLKVLMPEVTTPLDDPDELDYEDGPEDEPEAPAEPEAKPAPTTIKRIITQDVPSDKPAEAGAESDEEGEVKSDEENQSPSKPSAPAAKDKRKASKHDSDDSLSVSESSDEGEVHTPKDPSPQKGGNKDKKAGTTLRVINRRVEEPLLQPDEPQKISDKSTGPSRRPTSRLVHLWNLTRPFTLNQLKELLGRYGELRQDGFWIDKIKTHCFAFYKEEDGAKKAREALHETKWPSSNPKILQVEFTPEEEFELHQGLEAVGPMELSKKLGERRREKRMEMRKSQDGERPAERRDSRRSRDEEQAPAAGRNRNLSQDGPSATNGRAPVREWDRDKIRQSASPEKEKRPARDTERENRRPDRERERERRERREKSKKEEEQPVKMLDDLYRKTKAIPPIYWLPLTAEEIGKKEVERKTRAEEREKRLAEAKTKEKDQREKERPNRHKTDERGRERARDGRGRGRSSSGREYRRR